MRDSLLIFHEYEVLLVAVSVGCLGFGVLGDIMAAWGMAVGYLIGICFYAYLTSTKVEERFESFDVEEKRAA